MTTNVGAQGGVAGGFADAAKAAADRLAAAKAATERIFQRNSKKQKTDQGKASGSGDSWMPAEDKVDTAAAAELEAAKKAEKEEQERVARIEYEERVRSHGPD